jgi:DNA-binding CsgD family transcriptional regulator
MNLNPFEIELIKLLSAGYSQKEIAAKFKISNTNVNNFLSRARIKTGARSTIHLVLQAHKNKML